jgi:hypothetical protein
VAGNEMAEVIRPAAIAGFAHHRIQPAGGQCASAASPRCLCSSGVV